MPGIEALLAGRVLGERYRIEEVIGRGGMGAVYRATDERLGRPVAVKVITAASANDPEARERVRARFRHEANKAANLPHHPNVVPVYDYGTDPALGLDYIVMELLRGEDLAQLLQRAGPPPLGAALRILAQAARGVSVGHRMGLVHRDVKPGNIFLPEDAGAGTPEVRVLDFGIAKAIAEEDTQTVLTHDGRAPLSPAFASPEQLRGEPRLTPASDVFSLGAVGYQLLTGEKPFTEADRNRLSIGMQVEQPRSLRSRNPAIPVEVEEVIWKALAFDPSARFDTAGTMAGALEHALRRVDEAAAAALPRVGGPVVVADADGDDRTVFAGADDRTMLAPPRSAGPAAAAPRAAQPTPVFPPPRRVVEEKRKGPPAIVWVLLVAALGAGGFAAFQAMDGGREKEQDPLSALPDSARRDTAAADSVTVVDARVLDAEGRRMLQERSYTQALDFFARAAQADPERVEYRDHQAFALIRLRRFGEASAILEDAIRMDRNYDLSYSHLADARLALGDTAGAVQALRRFLEVSLNRADRDIARRRLDELTQPQPVIPAPPTIQVPQVQPPIDSTTGEPPRRDAPRDTIRLGPPDG
jgi:tRNA A-37 threonylcarbamoyl transferase component Bud32